MYRQNIQKTILLSKILLKYSNTALSMLYFKKIKKIKQYYKDKKHIYLNIFIKHCFLTTRNHDKKTFSKTIILFE